MVNRGGDADTTGAIAGMLAGALYGPEQLPDDWLRALDPEVRDDCARQAADLLLLAGRDQTNGQETRVVPFAGGRQ